MRLLIVSQYFYPEPFRITDIALGLTQKGWDIDVLTSVPNVPQGRFYEGYGFFRRGEREYKGIGVERVGVIRRGRGSAALMILNCASFAFNSLFHIPKYLKRGYDAVMVFQPSPVSMIWPANIIAKLKRIPNYIYVLDIWPESMYFLLGMKDGVRENSLLKRISRAVSRSLYRGAARAAVSSQRMEPKLRRFGLECPIDYLPNWAEALPVAEYDGQLADKLGLRDKFVVTFAGNIGTAQGLETAVEAAKCLEGETRLRWLMVGDGPAIDSLKERVRREGIEDRFVFTGWVGSDEIPAYMSISSALLVILKKFEIFSLTVPTKLQTYMHAKKPVIASIDGAGADIVESCGCGVSAPAEDVQGLCRAVKRLMAADEAELRTMGENGRRFCDENFEREMILERIDRALRDMVEEKQ